MPFFCSSSSVSSGTGAPRSREGGSGPGGKARSAPRSRAVSGQETLTLFTDLTSSAIRRACPGLFAQHHEQGQPPHLRKDALPDFLGGRSLGPRMPWSPKVVLTSLDG